MNLEHESPKPGDYIALTWKKQDNSIWGGTEGYVLGTVEGSDSQPYLVLDRSTYNKSFKSVLFSLGLFDLWMVPTSEVESVLNLSYRERPPGINEKMHLKMAIYYKSNLDYEETQTKLQKRGGCLVEPNQPAQTDGSCNFTVKEIESIKEATIVFSPTGNIQIDCLPKQLNQCLGWLEEAVEIFPGHKHLVLIPTNFMLNVHDIFKEPAEPTDEIIEKLAQTEGSKSIVFPLGWIHYFFTDLDNNPLRELFSQSPPLDGKGVFKKKKDKNRKKLIVDEKESPESELKKPVDLNFIKNQVSIDKYLSTESPVMQFIADILKPGDENGLKQWWINSRFSRWNWLDTGRGGFQGKALVRSLVID